MNDTLRAAAVQIDIKISDNAGNLKRVLACLDEAAAGGAKLIVFPECTLSGYCFGSLEEALLYCEMAYGPSVEAFTERCAALGVTGVLGLLEGARDHYYNSAVIATPNGQSAIYRKVHLPTLGVDRFLRPGDALPVYPTPFGKLGVLICYDIRFPEAARCLGLQGAEIIALPTNWPVGAESSPDFITRTRAWENRVWIVAANRVGVERGRRFIGRSQILSPTGQIVVEAGVEEETILYANLDLTLARQKRIVIEPGEWEIDVIGDRRPEIYGVLLEGL